MRMLASSLWTQGHQGSLQEDDAPASLPPRRAHHANRVGVDPGVSGIGLNAPVISRRRAGPSTTQAHHRGAHPFGRPAAPRPSAADRTQAPPSRLPSLLERKTLVQRNAACASSKPQQIRRAPIAGQPTPPYHQVTRLRARANLLAHLRAKVLNRGGMRLVRAVAQKWCPLPAFSPTARRHGARGPMGSSLLPATRRGCPPRRGCQQPRSATLCALRTQEHLPASARAAHCPRNLDRGCR